MSGEGAWMSGGEWAGRGWGVGGVTFFGQRPWRYLVQSARYILDGGGRGLGDGGWAEDREVEEGGGRGERCSRSPEKWPTGREDGLCTLCTW